MRKITKLSANALKNGINFKRANMKVNANDGINHIYLHDNLIGVYRNRLNELILHDAGWRTMTTKERLNGILNVFGLPYHIYQNKGEWYLRNYITSDVYFLNNMMCFNLNRNTLNLDYVPF